MSSPSKPLATRDINTSPPSPSKTQPHKSIAMDKEDVKPQSMEFHRQVLQSRLEDDRAKQEVYISPSDTIMSPCTAKLSAYKSKHFLKVKPQSLFAKMESSKKEDTAVEDAGEEGKDDVGS